MRKNLDKVECLTNGFEIYAVRLHSLISHIIGFLGRPDFNIKSDKSHILEFIFTLTFIRIIIGDNNVYEKIEWFLLKKFA